jgi:hypothetical protein
MLLIMRQGKSPISSSGVQTCGSERPANWASRSSRLRICALANLGSQAGEAGAASLPPVARNLLVRRRDQITARLGHQVTDHARLNVNGLHR